MVSADPLTAEQHAELERASERMRGLSKAARVASFNGYSLAVVAALSLPLAVFDWTSLIVTAVVGGLAWNELRGRAQLRALEQRAPRTLAYNQLTLLAVVIAYSVWSMVRGISAPQQLPPGLLGDPALAEMIEGMQHDMTLLVYGTVIVVSVLYQGLTARFYLRQRPTLDAFLADTPPWALRLLRS